MTDGFDIQLNYRDERWREMNWILFWTDANAMHLLQRWLPAKKKIERFFPDFYQPLFVSSKANLFAAFPCQTPMAYLCTWTIAFIALPIESQNYSRRTSAQAHLYSDENYPHKRR